MGYVWGRKFILKLKKCLKLYKTELKYDLDYIFKYLLLWKYAQKHSTLTVQYDL